MVAQALARGLRALKPLPTSCPSHLYENARMSKKKCIRAMAIAIKVHADAKEAGYVSFADAQTQ
jgi:hypothetical protein